MPPHTILPPARLLYFFTALVAASIVAMVEFAGAGQPEAQCKGNSPKKVCPTLLPADGATVAAAVTVTAEVEEAVASIAFAVDSVPLGPPDTTAPYQATWDTTKIANGTYVLRATAVDPSGKLSAREHEISVSNATAPPPPPSDTTAPTVTLTSPAAGATVSGSVALAANASDDVAVVGVQFKIDGANVGSEDTSAPYSTSWSSGNVSNGTHTVTAVARDAAGNGSASTRTRSDDRGGSPPRGDPRGARGALTSADAGAAGAGCGTGLRMG